MCEFGAKMVENWIERRRWRLHGLPGTESVNLIPLPYKSRVHTRQGIHRGSFVLEFPMILSPSSDLDSHSGMKNPPFTGSSSSVDRTSAGRPLRNAHVVERSMLSVAASCVDKKTFAMPFLGAKEDHEYFSVKANLRLPCSTPISQSRVNHD